MAINNNLLVCPVAFQSPVIGQNGLPLAAGVVTFYFEDNRQQYKTVYQQTGSPGAYTYVPLPNPNTLTMAGCIADANGSDVLPYFYPYDETNPTPTQQAYYVTVVDSGEQPQFVRQNFPFEPADAGGDTTSQELINLMPNGQFAAHNNIPNGTLPTGPVSVVVAPGGSAGWYFNKDGNNGSTDLISFVFLTQEQNGLNGAPNFALRLSCANIGSGAANKTLHVRFNNAGRFAGGTYTLYFNAISNTGPVTIPFNIVQNFGTNGAQTQITSYPGSQILPGQYQNVVTAITFPSTAGFATGPNNDDYVELVFILPPNSLYDVSLTNFFLTPGNLPLLSQYPQRPDHDVFATGIAGSMPTPNPDGSSFYLPIVYTPTGFNFDTSSVGKISGYLSNTLSSNDWLCDGSIRVSSAYDPINSSGIPNSRLFNYLYYGSPAAPTKNSQGVITTPSAYGNVPLFGTGTSFVTAALRTGTSSTAGDVDFYVWSNAAGVGAVPTDGIPASGLVFTPEFTFQTANITGVTAGISGQYTITAKSLAVNQPFNAVTTGGIFLSTTNPTVLSGLSNTNLQLLINKNAPNQPVEFSFTFLAAAIATPALLNSQYVLWYTPNAGTAGTAHYIYWGTDPAPVVTTNKIGIPLDANDTIADIVKKTYAAMNNGFCSKLSAPTQSVLSAGGYLTFTIGGVNYCVYNQINGSPTVPPNVGAGAYIPVVLVSGMTATQVATAYIQAINSYSYALPDLRGVGLRGLDTAGTWDIDNASRFSFGNPFLFGSTSPGTLEYDSIAAHFHGAITGTSGGTTPTLGAAGVSDIGIALNMNSGTVIYTQTDSGSNKAGNVPLIGPNTSAIQTSALAVPAPSPYNAGTVISQLGGQGSETRMVNMAVNWVIKY